MLLQRAALPLDEWNAFAGYVWRQTRQTGDSRLGTGLVVLAIQVSLVEQLRGILNEHVLLS